LYLTVGFPASLRIDDRLEPISDVALDAVMLNDILNSILTTRQRRDFESRMELNTALDMGGTWTFSYQCSPAAPKPGSGHSPDYFPDSDF
jgi:Tfp pilus assembly ATPase PilU